MTSGLHKIQDGGKERCAVCEFAKNGSVEKRQENHYRWYGLKILCINLYSDYIMQPLNGGNWTTFDKAVFEK